MDSDSLDSQKRSVNSPGRGTKGPLSSFFITISGSAEGAGEETYCRANENCSFEALLLQEKNSLFWNCAPRSVHVCGTQSIDLHAL